MKRGYKQNPNLSLEQLIAQGKEALPDFNEKVHAIFEGLKQAYPGQFGNAKLDIPPETKTEERIRSKLTDNGGDHSKITDIVRGRIIVDTPEQIMLVRGYLAEINAKYDVENTKDRFEVPTDTGHRDILMTIRTDNGHLAEFRFEQKDMVEYGKLTHEIYEEKQKIERAAHPKDEEPRPYTEEELYKIKLCDYACGYLHQQAANASGLDTVLGKDGQKRLAAFERDFLDAAAQDGGFYNKMDALVKSAIESYEEKAAQKSLASQTISNGSSVSTALETSPEQRTDTQGPVSAIEPTTPVGEALTQAVTAETYIKDPLVREAFAENTQARWTSFVTKLEEHGYNKEDLKTLEIDLAEKLQNPATAYELGVELALAEKANLTSATNQKENVLEYNQLVADAHKDLDKVYNAFGQERAENSRPILDVEALFNAANKEVTARQPPIDQTSLLANDAGAPETDSLRIEEANKQISQGNQLHTQRQDGDASAKADLKDGVAINANASAERMAETTSSNGIDVPSELVLSNQEGLSSSAHDTAHPPMQETDTTAEQERVEAAIKVAELAAQIAQEAQRQQELKEAQEAEEKRLEAIKAEKEETERKIEELKAALQEEEKKEQEEENKKQEEDHAEAEAEAKAKAKANEQEQTEADQLKAKELEAATQAEEKAQQAKKEQQEDEIKKQEELQAEAETEAKTKTDERKQEEEKSAETENKKADLKAELASQEEHLEKLEKEQAESEQKLKENSEAQAASEETLQQLQAEKDEAETKLQDQTSLQTSTADETRNNDISTDQLAQPTEEKPASTHEIETEEPGQNVQTPEKIEEAANNEDLRNDFSNAATSLFDHIENRDSSQTVEPEAQAEPVQSLFANISASSEATNHDQADLTANTPSLFDHIDSAQKSEKTEEPTSQEEVPSLFSGIEDMPQKAGEAEAAAPEHSASLFSGIVGGTSEQDVTAAPSQYDPNESAENDANILGGVSNVGEGLFGAAIDIMGDVADSIADLFAGGGKPPLSPEQLQVQENAKEEARETAEEQKQVVENNERLQTQNQSGASTQDSVYTASTSEGQVHYYRKPNRHGAQLLCNRQHVHFRKRRQSIFEPL